MGGNYERPLALLVTAIVLVSGGATGLPVFSTATAVQQDGASITFTDQTSNGTSVDVDSVALPSGGFAVIRSPDGSIVGVSEFLEAGSHADVTVSLDEPLTEDSNLVAVAHRDTNSNREFDFREGNFSVLIDFAYGIENAGQEVSDTALVNVEEGGETATETPAETTTVDIPPLQVETPEAPPETRTTSRDGDGEQVPFDGSTASIPGRIQVEEFDEGGPGVAYSDSDASNTGGEFRPNESVDIEATDDTGGEYNVGWTADGEWLEYTVDVTNGTYDVSARVASPESGEEKALRLELDGTTLDTIEIPQTGSYQEWQTVTLEDVPISGDGTGILRLEIVGGDYNINWVEFSANETDSDA